MKKDRELLEHELNTLSPRLREMRGQDDGFRHPADYFDQMEDDIFQQIDAIGARRKQAHPAGRPGFWNFLTGLWQPRLAMAFGAVLVIALAAWWLLCPQPTPETAQAPIAQGELTPEDAEAYVLENMRDFEPEQLAALASLDEEPANSDEPAPAKAKKSAPKTAVELSPEELERLLDDMSDEELEQLL